ncbi:MAG: hypothetical protein H6807_06100 [Planctomycetes bacterium]|nr:hypothetical protein [Planctomycetota bacterium]
MRLSLLLVVAALLPLTAPTERRPAPRPARVAIFLWENSPNDLEALAGLRRGLEVMAIEVVAEIRADQDEARARRELLALEDDGIDLLVALGTRSVLLAREVLPRTRIVFSAVTNPVLAGIAPGWAGSGGPIAGNSNWLDRRRMLEVFGQGVPGLRRLACLRTPGNAVSAAEFEEARVAAAAIEGLEIVDAPVADPAELPRLLDRLLPEVDAVWLPIDIALYQKEPMRVLFEHAVEARKPVVASVARAAGAGALLTLSVDYRQLGLKASSLVRRVLEGEDPGTIPIGRMSATRLHVDLDAARRIGLELPIDLLLDAHVISRREYVK